MANRNYIAEGSSSTAAVGAYPTLYVPDQPTTVTVVASSGAIISTYEGRINSNNALVLPGRVNMMSIWPYANDLGLGSTADYEALLVRYKAMFRIYRDRGWRLLAFGPPSRGSAWTGYANYNAAIAWMNPEMGSWVGDAIDGYFNMAADPTWGTFAAADDTSKYPDGVHCTAAGQSHWATVMKPSLDAVGSKQRVKFNWLSNPPVVVSFSPADNATNLVIGATFIVTFSEPVTLGTGTISLKKTSDNSLVDSWDAPADNGSGAGQLQVIGGNALHLHLTANLANSTEYYIVWTAGIVKDALNNGVAALSSTTLWSFTTADVVVGWTPLTASTPAIWWIDASNAASITKTGTAPTETVTQLGDLGLPTTHNMTPFATGPMYVANALNGKPGLDCTGRSLRTANFFKAAPFMLVMVWKQTGVIGEAYGVLFSGRPHASGDSSTLSFYNRYNSGNYSVFANNVVINQGVATATNTVYHSRIVNDGSTSSSVLNASNLTGQDFGIARIIGGISIGGETAGTYSNAIICEAFIIPYADHAAALVNAPTDASNAAAYTLAKWGV